MCKTHSVSRNEQSIIRQTCQVCAPHLLSSIDAPSSSSKSSLLAEAYLSKAHHAEDETSREAAHRTALTLFTQLHPDPPKPLLMSLTDEQERLIDEALDESPEDPTILSLKAISLMRKREWQRAFRVTLSAINNFSDEQREHSVFPRMVGHGVLLALMVGEECWKLLT